MQRRLGQPRQATARQDALEVAAMQLIELRSGREGHPSYRAVAHEMHAQIASIHPAVAAAMTHIDRDTEPRLERILSEMRSHARTGG